jgi:hypothetical protein
MKKSILILCSLLLMLIGSSLFAGVNFYGLTIWPATTKAEVTITTFAKNNESIKTWTVTVDKKAVDEFGKTVGDLRSDPSNPYTTLLVEYMFPEYPAVGYNLEFHFGTIESGDDKGKYGCTYVSYHRGEKLGAITTPTVNKIVYGELFSWPDLKNYNDKLQINKAFQDTNVQIGLQE